MLNQKESRIDQDNVSLLNFTAKLEILGSAIALFGGALSTIAGVIAYEETIALEAQEQQSQENQGKQFQMMQKQIDDLKNELESLRSQRG